MGPRWENSSSYCVMAEGTLWASTGESDLGQSLVCRKPDGHYRIAIVHDSMTFNGNLLGEEAAPEADPVSEGTAAVGVRSIRGGVRAKENQGPRVSGLSCGNDGRLLGVGPDGLYEIKRDRVKRLLRFRNTQQSIPWSAGHVYHWRWSPSTILVLGEDSYVVGATFGGVYWVRRQNGQPWQMNALDQKIGKPLVW